MINRNNKIAITFLLGVLSLCISQEIFAQRFTSSPYSRFGLGELATQGSARNKAMGGVGIALRDNIFLNPLNPASYTTLDSTTFIFDVGGLATFTELKNSNNSRRNSQVNFEYFSLGFSIKKWWGVSVGLNKFTNVGYDLDFIFKDKNTGNYTTQYTGKGGINKVYITNAFRLSKHLSLGVNANYNWGKITNTKSVRFQGNQGIPFNSNQDLTVSKFNFDFGLQYSGDFNEKDNYTIGVTFGNKTDLTGKYKEFLFRTSVADTISFKEANANVVEIPNKFGIGIAVNHDNKLTLAVDAHYQMWGDVKSLNVGNENLSVKLKNSYKIALGAEYTPQKFSGRRFFDRVSYRLGGYYNSSHLEINKTQLHELGITTGFGIPVRNSYMNIAFELGTRGTTSHNLIKENFARINVSFTLYEAWFQKILYN